MDSSSTTTDEPEWLDEAVSLKKSGFSSKRIAKRLKLEGPAQVEFWLRQRRGEFSLAAKGGDGRCRSCAKRAHHAHHAVPRSLSADGKHDLLNCLPLCHACHSGWHDGRRTIYRDAFTTEEWAFVTTLIGPGWLDQRYPERT